MCTRKRLENHTSGCKKQEKKARNLVEHPSLFTFYRGVTVRISYTTTQMDNTSGTGDPKELTAEFASNYHQKLNVLDDNTIATTSRPPPTARLHGGGGLEGPPACRPPLLRKVCLHLHDLSQVLQGLGRELKDVCATSGSAGFLNLFEGIAELSKLSEVIVSLQLERHKAVVGSISRELHRTRVAVQVHRL